MRWLHLKSSSSALLAAVGLILFPALALSQEAAPAEAPPEGPSWPIEVVLEDLLVVIYQPQPEVFEGNRLEGRFALSAQPSGGDDEPVFGTAWFQARVDTDRDERSAVVRNIEIVRIHFPDITPAMLPAGPSYV